VLELLIAEPDQRFVRGLVAEPVIAADLEDLGVDEALDRPEDIGVASPLNLAQQALLRGPEQAELADLREPVGEELLLLG